MSVVILLPKQANFFPQSFSEPHPLLQNIATQVILGNICSNEFQKGLQGLFFIRKQRVLAQTILRIILQNVLSEIVGLAGGLIHFDIL